MSMLVDRLRMRFGRLLVVARSANEDRGMARWRCRCDCGNVLVVKAQHLANGNTRSCGCLRLEVITSHRHAVAGTSTTYQSWRAMLARCYNPKAKSYGAYSVLGVTKPWRDSFEAFLADMGERPAGTSIDRIDNRFGYFLSNCRWATPKQQRANQWA